MSRSTSAGLPATTRACPERATGGSSSVALALALLASGALGWAPLARADEAAEAKRIFTQRCTACHTFGKGNKVGPDLKGVTERRRRPWLLKFIRSSQATIKAGDATAIELYQKFKQQRMPDWTDLSQQRIGELLDWLAANGPEQKEPDERPAEIATAEEVARGRALFRGSEPLASGGLPCGACHSVRDGRAPSLAGASLAADLTNAFARYEDRALTLFLKRPCSLREPELSARTYLTPQQSYALKAYLREAALVEHARAKPGAKP
jgi:mono/diheme cytochrome c family protein